MSQSENKTVIWKSPKMYTYGPAHLRPLQCDVDQLPGNLDDGTMIMLQWSYALAQVNSPDALSKQTFLSVLKTISNWEGYDTLLLRKIYLK
jgi:hypothetical protein